MNKRAVKYELDPQNLPELSEEEKARIERLAAMPDEQIDYSDIPPLSDAFWQQATRNPFYKPRKDLTTIRIDSDVLVWLKSKGKGYQTRINAILRTAMIEELRQRSGTHDR